MFFAKSNDTKEGEKFSFLWLEVNINRIPEIRDELIQFYREHGRELPWRGILDPYRVLIAEILLQKTASKPVVNVWKELVNKYPSFVDLSKADLLDLEEIIKPLGVHKRATLLLDLAKEIDLNYRGGLEDNKEKLMELPGVGDYTSSAVLSFGFNIKAATIDVNAARVYTRIAGFVPNTLRQGLSFAKVLGDIVVSDDFHQEINYGLLDLSAKICRPKPRCDMCPMKNFCVFSLENR